MRKTLIELGKDGTRTMFHRVGSRAWTHPVDDPYMMDFPGRVRRDSSPVRLPCPVCSKKAPFREQNGA